MIEYGHIKVIKGFRLTLSKYRWIKDHLYDYRIKNGVVGLKCDDESGSGYIDLNESKEDLLPFVKFYKETEEE